MPIGSYFPDRDQPALSTEDIDLVHRFHDLYYRRWQAGADTKNLSWFGHEIVKTPLDLWIYQELLVRTRPDVVIETGTYKGGSALFLATILEQIGHGRVITIDTKRWGEQPQHPVITYVIGSSTDPTVVSEVKHQVKGRALVILDSDHQADHVYEELIAYSPLVQPGDYLIVEDTNVNGHPTRPDFGPGPMEAVDRFLSQNEDFAVDTRCERFMLTLNPGGYLRRRSG